MSWHQDRQGKTVSPGANWHLQNDSSGIWVGLLTLTGGMVFEISHAQNKPGKEKGPLAVTVFPLPSKKQTCIVILLVSLGSAKQLRQTPCLSPAPKTPA